MTNLLNSGAFDYLKHDAKECSQVAVNSHRMVTPVQEIRNMLSAAAKRVSILADNYLNGATPDQIVQAVVLHRHIKFINPYNAGNKNQGGLTLDKISFSSAKKCWCFYFGNKVIPATDLDIQEVLGMLQTLENVLIGSKENTVKG